MRRYLLFSGETYYPRGGWKDFECSFDTHNGAVKAALKILSDDKDQWVHITDLETEESFEPSVEVELFYGGKRFRAGLLIEMLATILKLCPTLGGVTTPETVYDLAEEEAVRLACRQAIKDVQAKREESEDSSR